MSNRLVGRISESELAALVADDRLAVFENHTRDYLVLIPRESHRQMFDDNWSGHITTTDDFELGDFTDWYCYVAEHWKGDEGRPVVILYCHH